MPRVLLVLLVIAGALVSCTNDELVSQDEVFFQWNSNVVCGASIDNKRALPLDQVRDALERARDESSVLVLYGHLPRGDSANSVGDLDGVLAAIQESGLPFLTFAELTDTTSHAGVSLSFDDTFVDEWFAERETFLSYGAHVTFFLTRFHSLSDLQIDELRILEEDGHEIASHGRNHLNAKAYAEEHGVAAYMRDEFLPGQTIMQAAGFDPVSFAYPFGARSAELDEAILEHVSMVRGIPLVHNPCPR